ncbi:hypothetical protein CesoFtcFv8_025244 [Champsocephalus esox]|uniref:Uncharacterized protein n=1 Tax=Champsocephalus esox TaxID=159716 RepID=A0AAN8B4D4_9TELE|nr:hypothetical protein CesoFtcFv8_025244 [Champsocephalus esox]
MCVTANRVAVGVSTGRGAPSALIPLTVWLGCSAGREDRPASLWCGFSLIKALWLTSSLPVRPVPGETACRAASPRTSGPGYRLGLVHLAEAEPSGSPQSSATCHEDVFPGPSLCSRGAFQKPGPRRRCVASGQSLR